MDVKAFRGVMVGYTEDSVGYKIYYPVTGRIDNTVPCAL